MESYENKGIKDIIADFPEVADILEEYGIGCGPWPLHRWNLFIKRHS